MAVTPEIQKLFSAIDAAYEWLRDENDEVYLSYSTVETIVHAARWRLEFLEEEERKR